MSATLTIVGDTDRYMVSSSPILGTVKRGGIPSILSDVGMPIRTHSSIRRALFFLRILKNDKHLSTNFEINLLRVATCPQLLYFTYICGLAHHEQGLIWSEFPFIPPLVIRKSRNFLDDTPKMYLEGFSIMRCLQRILNVFPKWAMWSAALSPFTSMSSM